LKAPQTGNSDFVMKLYISGSTPRSKRAVENFRKLSQGLEGGDFEVIDVLEEPQAAENEKILATPLLIKHSPPPSQRIIGDLSDSERVLEVLGISDEDGKGGNGR